ncbi:hypothetical protein I317_01091 [Kwoniella heveanensis CBS 569]|nr:hypothetical protein I317_01091 [Kwoniella heveanensis CBS 569]
MSPRTRKSGAVTSGSGAAGGAGTTSRAKRAAGLSQPTLSFQSQRPSSLAGKTKSKSKSAVSTTPSLSEIEVEDRKQDAASVPSPSIQPSDEEVKEIEQLPKQPKGASTAALVEAGAGAGSGSGSGSGKPGQKRRQLDVKSKEWKGLVKSYKEAMGGMQPIHAGPDTHNDIHHILRVFDMTSSYGPCVGITRLQRWERAKKWGLNPPEEIRSILTTEQGQDDVRYRENVLHGWV